MVSFTSVLVASAALASTALAQRTIQVLAVQDLTLEDTFVFKPNTFTAAVGDTIEFHFAPTGFLPSNHSVAQGTFESSCTPMPNGFFSGFVPAMPKATPPDPVTPDTELGEAPKVFRVPVRTTNPMVFYCATAEHCTRGMYAVVNPSNTQNLASYKALIKKYGPAVAPLAVAGGQMVDNPGVVNPPLTEAGAMKLPTASAIAMTGAIAFALLLA
ncbi:uncharacterized protein DNG_00021 [Cephalotrichum gorgonifer]|uniref:Extracellular serine-rich protein n=1 Tax=Cephalotrichum gorgonifer TaxID=2041049 RepID=A0AAE8MNJ3_9PEZI|nr:uncharacterized protein DNG_00021 [Cephalotrichum gorgonifer]